jgi:serine/threonine-protein kinase
VGVLALAVLLVTGIAGFGYLRSNSPETPSTTEVPAVLGFSQAQAESMLHNAHLVPRVERISGPSATDHTVTRQSPVGGRLAGTNSTVTIQISTGPVLVTVPRGIVGRTATQAERLLAEAGFTNVTTKKAGAIAAPANTVTAIDPGEGRTATPDSLVTLTYTGPTGQPTKPAPTGARRNPVASPTTDTPRPPTSEKPTSEKPQATPAAKATQRVRGPKANKPGKAKTRTPKSHPHPDKRN